MIQKTSDHYVVSERRKAAQNLCGHMSEKVYPRERMATIALGEGVVTAIPATHAQARRQRCPHCSKKARLSANKVSPVRNTTRRRRDGH